ncbi:Protein quaking-B [Sciurus carolinensis]|uniref:Protein quaking-B n=1 Tax=Sciurus carolinensis TaxID=30640 RepID=A0AA41NLB8_SCICA|nr:Protein quaking-B [Sciurus carolinensis]MBZ3891852.1 Protein quaking-B [Sciurus carolinensis]
MVIPDYMMMEMMKGKKILSNLSNFCRIFNHLQTLLEEHISTGKIFGTRGLIVKQPEAETGFIIMEPVRGSMTHKKEEEQNTGIPVPSI